MHPLMPEVLGVPESDFIWLTNAGAIITSPLGSTARSIALACAMHGGKEVVILGHTDCRLFHPARYAATDCLRRGGVDLGGEARALDDFLRQLFDEPSSVRFAVKQLQESPFLPRSVPMHGLMVDTESGRLEWIINGYAAAPTTGAQAPLPPANASALLDFTVGPPLPPIGTV
jgi:carbonic anhydrase